MLLVHFLLVQFLHRYKIVHLCVSIFQLSTQEIFFRFEFSVIFFLIKFSCSMFVNFS